MTDLFSTLVNIMIACLFASMLKGLGASPAAVLAMWVGVVLVLGLTDEVRRMRKALEADRE